MKKRDRQARNAAWNVGRPYGRTLIAACCLIIPLFLAVCAKKIRKTVPDTKTDFHPEYDHEGFINDDHFRIIIIEPRLAGESHRPTIEKTARQRALASLQKYLLSQDRVVDQNATAELISIIDENGRLIDTGCDNRNRVIYYYEIRAERLRDRIDRISKKR